MINLDRIQKLIDGNKPVQPLDCIRLVDAVRRLRKENEQLKKMVKKT